MRAEELVDVSAVVNPWQALVLVVFIIVVLGSPSIAAWRSSRRAHREIVHQSNPNSGASLKDALNRIEARQLDQGHRIEQLEEIVERRGTLRKRRRP